jgi:hypothetical protein
VGGGGGGGGVGGRVVRRGAGHESWGPGRLLRADGERAGRPQNTGRPLKTLAPKPRPLPPLGSPLAPAAPHLDVLPELKVVDQHRRQAGRGAVDGAVGDQDVHLLGLDARLVWGWRFWGVGLGGRGRRGRVEDGVGVAKRAAAARPPKLGVGNGTGRAAGPWSASARHSLSRSVTAPTITACASIWAGERRGRHGRRP